MILLADIGATNARFCVTSDCYKYEHSESLEVIDSSSIEALCNQYLNRYEFTKHYHTHYGVEYNIVRPSGVYGPGDMDDRVLSKFFAKAMANQTIEVHDGSNKVDFTYVDEIGRASCRERV